MSKASLVAYNITAFISTLFLLEFGADKFIDHTAIVARRTSIPETIIALITAGGEWEELAVVLVLLAQHRQSLAIGTVVGAAISNILGAFSLGLLFYERGKRVEFDRSSRIYSCILLIVTTFVVPVTYFSRKTLWLVCGSLMIAVFGLYVSLVGWTISKGNLTAPEASGDDSSSLSSIASATHGNSIELRSHRGSVNSQANNPINPSSSSRHRVTPARRRPRSLLYHVFFLIVGFLAIGLAGYVLAQAATNITDLFHISDLLFGVVILAIATTLPEKFVAIMGGHRGHIGILVANTAGSNIFLLTLCAGIIMIDSKGKFDSGRVSIAELCVLWGATVAFTLTIWFGAKFSKWIGAAMLLSYVTFIVLEFTVIHSTIIVQ